jgi:hypothetical protein
VATYPCPYSWTCPSSAYCSPRLSSGSSCWRRCWAALEVAGTVGSFQLCSASPGLRGSGTCRCRIVPGQLHNEIRKRCPRILEPVQRSTAAFYYKPIGRARRGSLDKVFDANASILYERNAYVNSLLLLAGRLLFALNVFVTRG